ncbi:two-component sensor histidine kinase [Hymenobacter sp. UV11]|uniref:sensor histidine kinase n=1 Tax=Hymenobacter sp. UV11 TaxID=1849735 RepID=UPI00105FEE89|nr:ATP-binding protein [Hymenobacter sp. UV11]TDN39085.1 two-component sensor histidine kinase [Hymenobacter sp. UV11]TFZ65827.1 two-component sensor histidine kinase [Hymenobacter sp. UV11]
MTLSSRTVAVLIALVVAGVLTTFAYVAPTLPTHQAFLAAGITVAACFLLVYLSFEALIFREINGIYSRLEHIKRKEFKKLSNKFLFRPEPLQRIGDEIVQMAERRQQELDELKRLQALRREFLADVSHELKTPLFAAQGFVHTILDEEEDDAEYGGMDPAIRRKFLQRAAASLDALDALVKDLVTISQLEKGVIRMRRQRFDLVALVKELFELLEQHAERRGTTLELFPPHLAEKELLVIADRNRIRQVLTNLIDNAIKYGREHNGHVIVALTPGRNGVRVAVRDNGAGIAPEHQARIFERFYRVDKSRSRAAGGSGLGLAISKHIVEAHKSTIHINSVLNEGTTLEFKLPKPKEIKGHENVR